MGNRLTGGEKVVVSVFLVVLAGCVAGLFFVGGVLLDMKDAITQVNESLIEMRRNIADMREGLSGFGAGVSGRFNALEGRMSAVEATIEAPHGSPTRRAI